MSFSSKPTKNSEPLVKVVSPEIKNTSKSPIIFFNPLSFDEEYETSNADLQLKQGQQFQLIPNIKLDRMVGYITGQSGSGKTHFTIQFLKEYQMMFPDNEIILFSAIPDEGVNCSFRKAKLDITRIKLDEKIAKMKPEDFTDSCVIFDDIDTLEDKKILNLINIIRNGILERGRHYKTYCINTYHLPSNFLETRRLINEATFIVYFPKIATGTTKRVLNEYFGLSIEDYKKIKKMPTRWACLVKSIPNVLITQQYMKVLDMDDDDD